MNKLIIYFILISTCCCGQKNKTFLLWRASSGGTYSDVILQFGQSNSEGFDFDYVNNGGYDLNNANFQIYYKPTVTITDDGSWQTFNITGAAGAGNNLNPINKPTNKSHGEELSLCNEITKLGRKIYLIKLAAGATTLCDASTFNTTWGTWYPNSTFSIAYYRAFIDIYIKPALSKLSNPRIIAVTMHQGESDTQNDAASSAYATNLSLFWTTLINELGIPNCQKYICDISYFTGSIHSNNSIVNTALQNYCSGHSNFHYITDGDLANNGSHLTMASQETKGLRIFNDLKTHLETGDIIQNVTLPNYSNGTNFTFGSFNVNNQTSATTYTSGNSVTFSHVISDQTFSGDFEFVWELAAFSAGTGDQVGFDLSTNTTDTSLPSGWLCGLSRNANLSQQVYVGGSGVATISSGFSVGSLFKIKRVSGSVSIYINQMGTWVDVYDVVGTFNQTVRFRQRGFYTSPGVATILKNPRYN